MANDYLGAAAWCEAAENGVRSVIESWEDSEVKRLALESVARDAAHATVALSCVRAMQALASGKVHVAYYGYGEFTAWKDGRGGDQFTAPDPLTAITLALTEAGDALGR